MCNVNVVGYVLSKETGKLVALCAGKLALLVAKDVVAVE